jgi:hypothetical protein
MDYDLRRCVRDMPYRRRHEGLSVGEIYVLKEIMKFVKVLIDITAYLPQGPIRNVGLFLVHALALFIVVIVTLIVEREDVIAVNHDNKYRMIDSFTPEEAWHYLRFRIPELKKLFILFEFPNFVKCDNGIVCPGEHAFVLMLYRISYPTRLFQLQDIIGRDYSQLSRIFKFAYEDNRLLYNQTLLTHTR